ncbi:helix-turn-helix domain-containing protein [Nannocystaceae bacterium ST9]
MTIHARTIAAPASLRAWVHELWALRGRNPRAIEPIFPDVHAAELVFCRGPAGRFLAEPTIDQGARMVVGGLDRALAYAMPDPADLIGLRLPGGCACLLGIRPAALRGRIVALAELDRGLDRRLAEWQARERPASELWSVLAEHVEGREHRCAHRVRAAAARLIDAPIELPTLAAALGCSRRQLSREFAGELGISSRRFVQLARFARAWRALGRAAPTRWAQAALELGYCDQPHLIREFRALAGGTPARLFAPDWYAGVVHERPE